MTLLAAATLLPRCYHHHCAAARTVEPLKPLDRRARRRGGVLQGSTVHLLKLYVFSVVDPYYESGNDKEFFSIVTRLVVSGGVFSNRAKNRAKTSEIVPRF